MVVKIALGYISQAIVSFFHAIILLNIIEEKHHVYHLRDSERFFYFMVFALGFYLSAKSAQRFAGDFSLICDNKKVDDEGATKFHRRMYNMGAAIFFVQGLQVIF